MVPYFKCHCPIDKYKHVLARFLYHLKLRTVIIGVLSPILILIEYCYGIEVRIVRGLDT